MGLIEALLGNPLLLFFVIAALLSFFKGGKGNQEQKRNGRPNTGRNTQQEEVDWREIFRQEQTPPETHQPGGNQTSRPYENRPAEYTNTASRQAVEETYAIPANADKELNKANQQLQDRYEELKKRKKLAAEKVNQYQDSPIFQKDITREKVHLNFSNISRDEAIKGVVWSEILGKPKSQRHR